MCNVWNTNGCGYTTCCGCNNGMWNTLFGCSTQSICRDCCGNVYVNQRRTCAPCGCYGCGYGYGYGNRCGCGSGVNDTATVCNANGNTNGNGNPNGNTCGCGRFACLTVCGNVNTATQTATTNGDLYYARQYGLCGTTQNYCGCNTNG